MKIDKKLIKELVDYLQEFNLSELEYQEGQTKVKVSKALKSLEQSKTGAVVSPNKSVPGAKQFVQVGDKIKKGQTVMIVEAMKTMNHVPSTSDGVVKKILVGDGQPVEFGQTLILLN